MKTKLILVLIALIFVCPIFGQSNTTKRVAILEIVDKEGKMSYAVKLLVRSKLSTAITATPGYEGYDRVDISAIMSEHEFQRTGNVSESQIKRLGEMTGADYILIAEVAEIDAKNIIIIPKIINVESGKIENSANIYSGVSIDELEKNCRLLATNLLKSDSSNKSPNGLLTIGDHQYFGECVNDQPHGTGKMIFGKSDIRETYTGHWVDGAFDGYGVLIYKTGCSYEGNFKKGERHGLGTFYVNKSNKQYDYYSGEWNNGQLNKGEIYRYNKIFYRGGLIIDRQVIVTREGSGTTYYDEYYVNTTYVNDIKEGKATIHYSKSGNYEKGLYVHDKKEGKWILYNSRGKKLTTSVYKNGIIINKKDHKRK